MITKIEKNNYYFSNKINLLYFGKTINNEKHDDVRKKIILTLKNI